MESTALDVVGGSGGRYPGGQDFAGNGWCVREFARDLGGDREVINRPPGYRNRPYGRYRPVTRTVSSGGLDAQMIYTGSPMSAARRTASTDTVRRPRSMTVRRRV